MTTLDKITPEEFKLMSGYIEKNCGIHLTEVKAYLVESRLTAMALEKGCSSFTEFYRMITTGAVNDLRDKIIDAMTTNETLWFRDAAPFDILENNILTKMTEEIKAGKRRSIAIWCAACSTGQEPYSIAIRVQEFARKQSVFKPSMVKIIATDISPSVLFLAKAGRYDSFAMSRGMPDDLKNRYFKSAGNVWEISPDIKRMVNFQKLNLQESFTQMGQPDIIFCRNVLFYFSENFKKDIYERLAKQLNRGGILFIGASETMLNDLQLFLPHRETRGVWYEVNK